MALIKCKECGNVVRKKAKKCPKCGAPVGPKQYSLFSLILIVGLGWFIYSTVTNEPGITTNEPKPKDIALKNVSLDFEWTKAAFGNVMEANFTVKNNSNYNIKDLKIKCIHTAASGTKIDSNTRTIYQRVDAKKSKKFTRFNMGFINSQVKSSSCSIIDLMII